jgi:hypothetical protein
MLEGFCDQGRDREAVARCGKPYAERQTTRNVPGGSERRRGTGGKLPTGSLGGRSHARSGRGRAAAQALRLGRWLVANSTRVIINRRAEER